MSILFLSEGVTKPRLRYRDISVWINTILKTTNHELGDLTYIFCTDDFLYNINKQFLAHDYYTDIVTFDYSENALISGDMFISVDRVKENSFMFSCRYNDEILRVMVHGLLHLLGYNDFSDDEKKIMRRLEDEYVFMYKEIGKANSK